MPRHPSPHKAARCSQPLGYSSTQSIAAKSRHRSGCRLGRALSGGRSDCRNPRQRQYSTQRSSTRRPFTIDIVDFTAGRRCKALRHVANVRQSAGLAFAHGGTQSTKPGAACRSNVRGRRASFDHAGGKSRLGTATEASSGPSRPSNSERWTISATWLRNRSVGRNRDGQTSREPSANAPGVRCVPRIP